MDSPDCPRLHPDCPPTLTPASPPADPAYPPDGISLLPALLGSGPVRRTLFWRFRANGQRAIRDGRDNTFMFDVVADPLERANLKDRHPDDYRRRVTLYEEWNAAMLPESPESLSHTVYGDQLADRYGSTRK